MSNFALSFDGIHSYVACGVADPSVDGFSVGGWLKWNGANVGGSSQVLIAKHTIYGSNMRWWVGLDKNNSMKFLVYGDGGAFPFWNYVPPSDGTVIHWVWVHDTANNVEKLYINGVFHSNISPIALGGQSGANLQIGASSNGLAEWLNGTEEDVFVNTTILNATQISNIFNNSTNPASLLGAWATYSMDEGSGTTTADSSGSNTGTLSGSTLPTWVSYINPNDAPIAPTVTDSAATSIADTSATGNGNVTSDGGATITERGVCWDTSANPTTSNSKQTASGTTGSFTANMTGLTRNTTYHYRAYAINSVGTSYGSDQSFTTLADAPTVTDSGASSITSSSAVGNGNVTSDGGATITERGFVLSLSANPTVSDTKVIVSGTTGSYTGNLTGLSPNTLYHYRAYATNSVGTSYASDQTFTTTGLIVSVDQDDSWDSEEKYALRNKMAITSSNFSRYDLRKLFYAGDNKMVSQNDAVRAWLQSQTNLTTIQSLGDLWRQYFIQQGVPNEVSLSDMAKYFFSNIGF